MQIEFAHICENVIVAKNGNLSIINIFNQINADAFPAVHPNLTVVISASGEEGEYEVNIEIKRKEDDKSIMTQRLPNKIKIPKLPAQGRFFINFSPLVLSLAGHYEIIVSIAGQTKTLNFEAKQIQK